MTIAIEPCEKWKPVRASFVTNGEAKWLWAVAAIPVQLAAQVPTVFQHDRGAAPPRTRTGNAALKIPSRLRKFNLIDKCRTVWLLSPGRQ